MPNTFFTHKEVVEALATKAGLPPGIYQLVVEFGQCATNAMDQTGKVSPVSMSFVSRIGVTTAEPTSPPDLVAIIEPKE